MSHPGVHIEVLGDVRHADQIPDLAQPVVAVATSAATGDGIDAL